MKQKKFAVVARTPGVMKKGLDTGLGHHSFCGKAQLIVTDPVEAAEIEARYGKKGTHQVNVVEDPRLGWHYNHDCQTDGRNALHRYCVSGIDTSHIRTTKDNGFVWVWMGARQVRMQRCVALEEGYEIIPKKRVCGRKPEV